MKFASAQAMPSDVIPPALQFVFGVLALLTVAPAVVPAEVLMARDEALVAAFPDADRRVARDVFLTTQQRQEIEQALQKKIESDLLTFYVGYAGDKLLGYALFDTHPVRTMHETLLTVFTPDGVIAATHLLAFHEPIEYRAPDRWLALFNGKTATDLASTREVAAIAGSTLTARAVSASIRRAMASYQVAIAPRRAAGDPDLTGMK